MFNVRVHNLAVYNKQVTDNLPRMKDYESLRRLYRVHNACIQLENAMKILYIDGLNDADISQMQSGKSTDEMLEGIVASPATSIATYLKNAQSTLDISKIIEYYNFDSKQTDLEVYTQGFPILLNGLPNKKSGTPEDNSQKLKVIGQNWLKALISLIVYERFPFADSEALETLTNKLISDGDECFKGYMDSTSKVDPKLPSFDIYIGSLVIDRCSGFQLEEIKEYIQAAIQEKAKTLSMEMINGLYRQNPKFQVMKLLENNKTGASPQFNRVNTQSKSSKGKDKNSKKVIIEIKLKNVLLGSGSGTSVTDAEQNAAKDVLAKKILDQYSIYKNIQPIKTGDNGDRNKKPEGLPAPSSLNLPQMPPPPSSLKMPQLTLPTSSKIPHTAPSTQKRFLDPALSSNNQNDSKQQNGKNSTQNSRSNSRRGSRQASVSDNRPKRLMGIKGLRQKDNYTLRLEERAREVLLENAPRVSTDLTMGGPPSFDDDSDEDQESARRASIISIRRSSVLNIQNNTAKTSNNNSRRRSSARPWEDDTVGAFARPLTSGFSVDNTSRTPSTTARKLVLKNPIESNASVIIKNAPAASAATAAPSPTTITASINTVDKEAKNKLQAHYVATSTDSPTYFTKFMGPGKFLTICRLRDSPDTILAEAEGKSKDISQLMAASVALAAIAK